MAVVPSTNAIQILGVRVFVPQQYPDHIAVAFLGGGVEEITHILATGGYLLVKETVLPLHLDVTILLNVLDPKLIPLRGIVAPAAGNSGMGKIFVTLHLQGLR